MKGKRKKKGGGNRFKNPLTSRREWAVIGRNVGDFFANLIAYLVLGLLRLFRWVLWSGYVLLCGAANGLKKWRQERTAAKAVKAKETKRPEKRPEKPGAAPQEEGFRPVSHVPRVGFDDIVGLEEVKNLIGQRIVRPFEDPVRARELGVTGGGALLLVGPPGNAKTMMAQAVAREVDAVFFPVRSREIVRGTPGVAESRIHKLFETARKYPKAVMFIDEADWLLRENSGSSVMPRAIREFQIQTEGLETPDNGNALLIIGATNKPHAIGAAARSRFGVIAYVGMPERDNRVGILLKKLEGRAVSPEVDADVLADRTAGFSGRDLKNLVDQAAREALSRETPDPEGNGICIMVQDFEAALQVVKPTVPEEDLRKWEKVAA